MSDKQKTSSEGAELHLAVEQMKNGMKGRSYTRGQILAVSARRSVDLTQRKFAKLLDVSVDTVQDWEQGRRFPRGAGRTLLEIVQSHPKVLEEVAP